MPRMTGLTLGMFDRRPFHSANDGGEGCRVSSSYLNPKPKSQT